MSLFASRALRSIPRSSVPRSSIVTNTRCFHASTTRAALSESDHSERQREFPMLLSISHTDSCWMDGKEWLADDYTTTDDHDDRKAKIDHHKDDQLNKQKEGRGHWKQELSSNSEAAIKADREEISNVEEDIAALQKETEQAVGNEKK
ncbi:MAG: hypothetical protein Q9166_006622 [cf. Caloplaca sp. 2 TL-2023]